MSLDLAAIRGAHERIRPYIVRTPVVTSEAFNAELGAELFFKCENLQRIGAFKARGATNAIFSLGETEAARGVCTHSSGNHGAAVARAARLRGIKATIVVPSNAPAVKVRHVEAFGATLVRCEPTLAAREAAVAKVVASTGATLVHPFDDLRVAAGQGTAAIELLEDVPGLHLMLCPVGGGGLLSGTAIATKALVPTVNVIAVEPEGAADAAQSFRAGRVIPVPTVNTIADGLRTTIGEENLRIARSTVSDIVTVSDTQIIRAMRALWENLRLVVEPSGAVPFAAIEAHKVAVLGKRVGVILTGGNVDLDALPW